MALRKFKADEVVYHQGDPAAHAYVVVDGLVKVLLLDENGRELLVSLHRRGGVFRGPRLILQRTRDGAAAWGAGGDGAPHPRRGAPRRARRAEGGPPAQRRAPAR